MDNRNRQSVPPAEGPAEPDMEKEVEQRLPPAGRISTLLFLTVGLIFFVQSLQLFLEDPSPSGYGIFPLLVSGLLLILTVVDYIQKLKIKSELDGLPMKEKVTITIKYLFPVNSVIFLFMSIAFYIAITLGVPFMVAATDFHVLPDSSCVCQKLNLYRGDYGYHLCDLFCTVQGNIAIGR